MMPVHSLQMTLSEAQELAKSTEVVRLTHNPQVWLHRR